MIGCIFESSLHELIVAGSAKRRTGIFNHGRSLKERASGISMLDLARHTGLSVKGRQNSMVIAIVFFEVSMWTNDRVSG